MTVSPDDLIFNKRIGGVYGTDFQDSLWRHNEDYAPVPVDSVDVWYGAGPLDHTILKALQVHWINGKESPVVGDETRDALLHTRYDFRNGDSVKWLKLFGTGVELKDQDARTDSIIFEEHDPFAAGGTWGYDSDDLQGGKQDLGDGVLYGFVGSAGTDINSLGTVFHKKE
ncbi:hypothetical protein BDV36DRAFT_290849 [Aspergillus pseudocaelatus]|uniref:Jacalin-type lectin domain-containing protein n=1 Tax=Aspergillus pseudocaelatus TaxID=1825620 RepID=A0ABQ6X134_9EURO|nr:hypothetical protein BDV36DRAFT_290849 [Aspergillus pseudocaelatus]